MFFEEDGAGCFSGHYGRNSTRFYKRWLKETDENGNAKTIGVSGLSTGEAQDNKTLLDTHFSFITPTVEAGVTWSEGKAVDAESIVKAIRRAKLRATNVWWFKPDRTGMVQTDKKIEIRIHYGNVSTLKNIEEGQLVRNYGLGKWRFIPNTELDL